MREHRKCDGRIFINRSRNGKRNYEDWKRGALIAYLLPNLTSQLNQNSSLRAVYAIVIKQLGQIKGFHCVRHL